MNSLGSPQTFLAAKNAHKFHMWMRDLPYFLVSDINQARVMLSLYLDNSTLTLPSDGSPLWAHFQTLLDMLSCLVMVMLHPTAALILMDNSSAVACIKASEVRSMLINFPCELGLFPGTWYSKPSVRSKVHPGTANGVLPRIIAAIDADAP